MRNWKKMLTSSFLGFAAAAILAMPAFAIDNDIVILHTNDTHCGIEDNVGFSGLAAYKEEMKELTPYVALVDAGDAIQGAPVGTLSEGGYLVEIMNEVGYDFAIPGNHEFDYGMERLLALSAKMNSEYYSCNFINLPSKTTVFKPYKMMEYDDVKVALIGISTPESITKSTPAYFQDLFGRYKYGFCEDMTGEALYAQVQKYVDKAHAEGADYVIAVGHLGMEGTTDRWTSASVIANTNGIDVVIDGHSHQEYTTEIANKDGEAVKLTQTGTKFANIGKVTITPDGEIKTEMVANVPAGGETAKAETDALISGIKAQYEESLKTVLGHTDVDLTANNPETGMRAVRNAETNLGDFCADAMRLTMGADIGIMNGGGIRASIDAGDITYEDALNVYPYGNMICVTEITGQQLKDALEMGVSLYPEESGGFIHVSGMTYSVDTSILSSVQTDAQRVFVGVTGAYRVHDIYVGGEPLDTAKTYTVASHNYWLKSAGDGMSMFLNGTIIKDETMVDVDTITTYISEYLGGSVGEEYANPYGQGRITIQ